MRERRNKPELTKQMQKKTAPKLEEIRLLAMDVDGVLTDGRITINADGSESKGFNVLDGHGIRMWHRAGLETALISSRSAAATTYRAEQLEIKYTLQDCHEKLPAFEQLLRQTGVSASQVAYIGDDLVDLPIMVRVGFAVAVANAVPELKQQADYVTLRQGGSGAVREVVEYILKATGRWQELLQRYLV